MMQQSSTAVDQFLPTAERVQPGDVLTRLGDETFPVGAVVLGVTALASGGVRLVLESGAVTVVAETPVDLLPPF